VSRTNRRIETHIVIDAPPAAVWSVLTDWEHLADWSTSFVRLEGEFADGSEVTATFKVLGIKRRLKRTLRNVQEGAEFGWSDKFALGMVDRHRYRVESEGPHLTRFVQSDKVMGGTSLVFGALTAALLRNMYVEFNQQLMTEVRRRIAAGEI
jgi:uncharacterized protein YndB with AHSA1/START domain